MHNLPNVQETDCSTVLLKTLVVPTVPGQGPPPRYSHTNYLETSAPCYLCTNCREQVSALETCFIYDEERIQQQETVCTVSVIPIHSILGTGWSENPINIMPDTGRSPHIWLYYDLGSFMDPNNTINDLNGNVTIVAGHHACC